MRRFLSARYRGITLFGEEPFFCWRVKQSGRTVSTWVASFVTLTAGHQASKSEPWFSARESMVESTVPGNEEILIIP